jgi:hypothetical protein
LGASLSWGELTLTKLGDAVAPYRVASVAEPLQEWKETVRNEANLMTERFSDPRAHYCGSTIIWPFIFLWPLPHNLQQVNV